MSVLLKISNKTVILNQVQADAKQIDSLINLQNTTTSKDLIKTHH